MSVHITCAECQKMYSVLENNSKEKTHVYGLCPECSLKDCEYRKKKGRKEKKDG